MTQTFASFVKYKVQKYTAQNLELKYVHTQNWFMPNAPREYFVRY